MEQIKSEFRDRELKLLSENSLLKRELSKYKDRDDNS